MNPPVLHCSLARSSLGTIVVAGDGRVRFALLGDDARAVLTELGRRSAGPPIAPGESWRAEANLLAAMTEGDDVESPTLDPAGTPFQLSVWREIQLVRRGETITYAELARAVGRPQAVRAVASACAANPIAVFIPCHRVLRSDGKEGGYRWELWRKRALLEREQAPLTRHA